MISAITPITMAAVLRLQVLTTATLLILLPLTNGIDSSVKPSSVAKASAAAFQFPSSTSKSKNACRRHYRRHPITASLVAPDYYKDDSSSSSSSSSYCYIPPYGMVSRSSSTYSSPIVLNMAPYSDAGYSDDRYRKKSAERNNRVKDPVIQDFGNMQDWQESKTGLGRMGDDKMGDDGVSERGGEMMYDRDRNMRMGSPPPMPPMLRDNEPPPIFEGEGGNYWVNPTGSMDRYPSGGGENRRRGRRNRRRNNRRRMEDEDEEWWETRRSDEDMLYEDDYDFDEEFDNEYGVPPPSRSRSSFRSGAPPPPRPVKQFYDKLFWFGFDPDVTRPTDRTMFGGTRGKFNAMDLLRDREDRQIMRSTGRRMMGGAGDRSALSRRGKESVIQDFGSVNDWNARKNGKGRTGGDAVGDDNNRPNFGYDSDVVGAGGGPMPFPGDMPPPPPPRGMPEYDFESSFDDMDFEQDRAIVGRRRARGGRRRRRDSRRRDIDRRALEYDRFLAGGNGGDDEYMDVMDNEYMPPMEGVGVGRRNSRRRKGFAYKFNTAEDLFDLDDGEYIDVEPKYATERDLDMAREMSSKRAARRRSWEERAIEMDRVPPRGAVAWGPNGRLGEEDPLDRAAMDALRNIKKSKRKLERKENEVEDAKEEVVSLKADASNIERQLEDATGRYANKLEEELGYLLRDVEDASRNLRLARAERDAASNRVSDLEERNWALLSEYESARSLEEDMD